MKKIIMTMITGLTLMTATPSNAQNLGVEMIEGVNLNMTIKEASNIILEKGYTELKRENKSIVFVIKDEEGRVQTKMSIESDLTRASGIGSPGWEDGALTSLHIQENRSTSLHSHEVTDEEYKCTYGADFYKRFCEDKKIGKCQSYEGAKILRLRTKTDNDISLGGFFLDASDVRSLRPTCQVTIMRKRSKDPKVNMKYMGL